MQAKIESKMKYDIQTIRVQLDSFHEAGFDGHFGVLNKRRDPKFIVKLSKNQEEYNFSDYEAHVIIAQLATFYIKKIKK